MDTWYSDEKLPCVVIDMKEPRKVSAPGYYPHTVVRHNKPVGWNTRDEAKSLVSRYKIYASLDGVNYTELASVTSQELGSEKIVEFDATVARFIKFEVLGNVGIDTHRANYADTQTIIGNLSLFE